MRDKIIRKSMQKVVPKRGVQINSFLVSLQKHCQDCFYMFWEKILKTPQVYNPVKTITNYPVQTNDIHMESKNSA